MKTNITYNGIAVSKSDITRFWQKVKKTNDCWNWDNTLRDGYGMFSFNGRPVGAHRFSFAIEHGSIKEGAFVCHTCDNPQCVRPKHLYLGTQNSNMKDRSERDRTPSDFTSAQIEQARIRAARGENLYAIASDMGTDKVKSLLQAIRGGTFKHVKTKPVAKVDISKERKVRSLSNKDIEDIKKALEKPYWGIVKKLADKYGVSHTAISLIRSGRYKK